MIQLRKGSRRQPQEKQNRYTKTKNGQPFSSLWVNKRELSKSLRSYGLLDTVHHDHGRVRLKRWRKGAVHGVAVPVVGPRPLPPKGFSPGVSSGPEAEAIEEVGVDGEAPEVGDGGGGAGGSGAAGPGAGEGVGWAGGVVGVQGHWVAATWQEGWGGEAGEVEV